MNKLRIVTMYEKVLLELMKLEDEARANNDKQMLKDCQTEIQHIEGRINDVMDWPDFNGANERFRARKITRKEYKQFSRLSRQDKGVMGSASDLHYHFQDSKHWVHWVNRCSGLHEGDMFLYHAASEGYAARVDEAIADWGGSMWEAEIERAVSAYHFWGDSGGLRIS